MAVRFLIVILFVMELVSCNNFHNEKYSYVEKVETTSIFGETTIELEEPKDISASSDSLAYLEAFKMFAISKKVYCDMQEAGYGTIDRPLSFSLYNSKGEDITDIYFATKQTKENEISESIFSQPNSIKDGLEAGKTEKAKEQLARRDSAKIKELISYFQEEKDEFDVDGTTWYKPKNAPKYINRNGIYVYFGVSKHGVTPLRLKIQYEADDWLFFKKVNFAIDGNAFEYIPPRTETDHGGGRIWEWTDAAIVSSSDKDLIKALSSSKSAKMKFIGRKYYSIKNITPKQIQSINRTIELYRAMGGEF